MQLNDHVREFFANYYRAFEAFDAGALSAFFSYPVLFTRADPVRPQTMMASTSDYISAIAPLIQAYRDLNVESGKVWDRLNASEHTLAGLFICDKLRHVQTRSATKNARSPKAPPRRKHPSTPRYREDYVPCGLDPSGKGTVLRGRERGGHSLAFYFWALSQSI